MQRFFVEENQINMQDNTIEILGEDVNHIKNVLRCKIGEKIEACNKNNNTCYSAFNIKEKEIMLKKHKNNMKKIYPNAYFSNVLDIKISFLLKNKIKVLILDVDNTLIDYNKNLSEEIINWSHELQGQGIKMYILSNTNKKQKVEDVANKLEIPYEYFAKKPSKKGFIKIQNKLNINPKNIAVVGDQIFTDVIGGNRCNMFTILVDPLDKKDFWYTAWKRPIENKIKKKIIKGEKNVF